MKTCVIVLLTALICVVPAATLAVITDFTQDFETLNAADPDALGNDGWLVYGTVFEVVTGNWLYGYGAYPAPNNPGAPAFSNIVTGEGGVEQGAQQLSVFSDYENTAAQLAGHMIEASFFKEFAIDASDVGKTCTFAFSAKMGALVAPSTAWAFIKTLDPGDNYTVTNLVTEDMTAITTAWDGWSLELTIDSGLVGQIFQVGFSNTAANYDGSSIIYDNAELSTTGGGPATGIVAYAQDFESLNAADLEALGNDGWTVYGNVFDGTTTDWLSGYGPYPAPNNPAAPAFSTIVAGEGGVEQGAQQMSVFSDYENAAVHTTGDILESIVYREMNIEAGDVGKTWIFSFQAKHPGTGAVAPPSEAVAFIKTIDPATGYAMTNYITEDMTSIGTAWSGWSLSLTIDAGLEGQFFQIGFSNRCSDYNPSTVIYDNVELYRDLSSVPDHAVLDRALRQNYPNPFNPMTRIEFSMANTGHVDISVYDVSGRLVANLLSGSRDAGDHHVTWNGTDHRGARVATGVYHYVMKTVAGRTSRSMILLK